MSHLSPYEEEDDLPMLKQRPKRPFELSSLTPASSAPSTPPADNSDPTFLQAGKSGLDGNATPSRTRSFLNLTSSTLFGIYAPTGFATDRDETTTPWGTGAQTPAESRHGSVDLSRMNIPDMSWHKDANGLHRRRSTVSHVQHAQKRQRKGFRVQVLPLLSRTTALFAVGMLYGLLISHLHNRQQLTPVQVKGIDSSAWPYFVFWGATGALLGQALPWLDAYWNDSGDDDDKDVESDDEQQQESKGWNEAVRTITAFVGIAFAIRKLPWESELQLSLTLALANPAVWYLIDRTPPGFILSTVVALLGTAGLLGINPSLVPPAQVMSGHASRPGQSNTTAGITSNEQLVLGVFSQESVGVATWISSVLFVSSVCFGNLGRRLGPQSP